MTDYKIIQTINGPEDVKKLSMEQLEELASEIREALFNRLTKIGGHFGPNFGMVEAEIAMHYVFSSPKDKFIFDVSHQSYPHKILTGRKNGYISDEHFSEDSGYTNPEESEHDFFNVGHTSTSVSLATGLAKARDIKGDKENIIAIIGDGSLSGGEALEGLNVAGSEINSNLIIIVNDNEQSIAEVHGGMYKNLAELRETGAAVKNSHPNVQVPAIAAMPVGKKTIENVLQMLQVLKMSTWLSVTHLPNETQFLTNEGTKIYRPVTENQVVKMSTSFFRNASRSLKIRLPR